MQVFEFEREVIEAAKTLAASLGDDPNHTVASVAMDIEGNIYTGVNVHHFTGGPCAELVVLGAAAAAGSSPLMTIAAAGDHGRGIISPCGRCRQVLLDLHPDISVVIPGDAGPEVKSIRELLPARYVFADAQVNRFVRFDKLFLDPIRSGNKTTTVRWQDPITTGRKTFVFEDHPEHALLFGEVLQVDRYRLLELTPEQAGLDPDTDMQQYRDGLRQRYPDMPENAEVDVVAFRLLPTEG